jgi:hypothetical protein
MVDKLLQAAAVAAKITRKYGVDPALHYPETAQPRLGGTPNRADELADEQL